MNDLINCISAKPTISWLREQEEKHLDEQQILDNFLNDDLHNTSDPIINPDDFLLEECTLNSTVLVQINEIIDISLPFIKRKDFIINKSEKRRTFKFLLSDGHFQFAAISKDHLSEFNPLIVPGLKIRILKGTKMKFGILFLENDKLEIVGGQSLDLKSKRHSIVLYDEQKYNNQGRKLNELDSINQNVQPKTKKRNASLIITKEEKNKSKAQNKTQLPKKKNNQNTIRSNNILNDASGVKMNDQSFLDNEFLSLNSDDAIEKVEKETTLQELPSISNSSIVDQISFSSYSSDVEIINSLTQKPDKQAPDSAQNNPPQNRKFLSDDDDLDDFDFDYLQNSNKSNNNDNESCKNSFRDLQKMKIWTMDDLIKREGMLSSSSYSSNTEIILLDGYIVECSDLKIIQKKNNCGTASCTKNLFFSMNCKIACDERTMEMKVASKVISDLLESSPEDWMNLDFNEQIKRYEECSKALLSFKSPLFILNTGINETEISHRYLIVNEEFLNLI